MVERGGCVAGKPGQIRVAFFHPGRGPTRRVDFRMVARVPGGSPTCEKSLKASALHLAASDLRQKGTPASLTDQCMDLDDQILRQDDVCSAG